MRIGIVYSDTSASRAFSVDNYNKLFMDAQAQVMSAGIPFDILTESDLVNINQIKDYDTLLFPSFSAAPAHSISDIENTLILASKTYNVGLVSQGDFLVADETGNSISYNRMESILGLTRAGGANQATFTTVARTDNSVLDGYEQGEVLGSYNLAYSYYSSTNNSATALADIVVDGQSFGGVLATSNGSRNVHFATDGLFGDNNLLAQALQWSAQGDKISASLSMTRQAGLTATRIDMDYSQEKAFVSPVDQNGQPTPGVYDIMLPIVEKWKADLNFVGSFYINVGNDPAAGLTTDWAKSAPYYQQLLALGNEIGTHSYTHPLNTNVLTPTDIQFEFQGSKQVIEQQLGIAVTGAAVPGDPEVSAISRQIGQYFDYMSGGTIGRGAGYLNALGYVSDDDQNFVYIAPNVASDFSQLGFYGKTTAEADAFWANQFSDIVKHSPTPVVVWGIHDYGIAEQSPIYDTDSFTRFFERSNDANFEFVTLDDLSDRISAQQKANFVTQLAGNVLTATVTPNATAPDVGEFALNVTNANGQVIESVQNWYAYDEDSVFLPKAGGEFQIAMGASQSDITRISKLPSRADLISVTGDQQSIAFEFFGEGEVDVKMKSQPVSQIAVSGTTDAVLNGSQMELTFHDIGSHKSEVLYGGVVTSGRDGVIMYFDGASQQYAKLYQYADGTGFTQFSDVTGTAAWESFISYRNNSNAQYAQTIVQRDGSGWTQFWDTAGDQSWQDFTSYSDAQSRQYAETVNQRDGSGWTRFLNVDGLDAWSQFASYRNAQGQQFSTTTINTDGSKIYYYEDVADAYDWATYTQVQDPDSTIVSYYGTDDDGNAWRLV